MATITFDPLLNRLEFSQSTVVTGAVIYKGGYNAATNTPDLTTSPASIKAGAMYTVTAAGTLYGETVEIGDSIIAEIDNPTAVGNWTFLQKNTTGGGTPALNNGQIFVGNASNAATSVAMSGDTTIDNAGAVTIGNDKVTYPKMQDTTQASVLGTALGAGTVSEIPIVEQYLSAGTTATLLENTSNWDVNGVYTGTAITGTYQGQAHVNANYWFTATDDNVWIRLIRG